MRRLTMMLLVFALLAGMYAKPLTAHHVSDNMIARMDAADCVQISSDWWCSLQGWAVGNGFQASSGFYIGYQFVGYGFCQPRPDVTTAIHTYMAGWMAGDEVSRDCSGQATSSALGKVDLYNVTYYGEDSVGWHPTYMWAWDNVPPPGTMQFEPSNVVWYCIPGEGEDCQGEPPSEFSF